LVSDIGFGCKTCLVLIQGRYQQQDEAMENTNQPQDNLIRELLKHDIEYVPCGADVQTVCPIKPENDGLGGYLGTFIINSETKIGTCAYCHGTAAFSAVLERFGKRSILEAPQRDNGYHDTNQYVAQKTEYERSVAVLPTIYSWKDFSNHKFPWANQWRVKGLIPISARCVIAAPSGEGKSWLAMEMARCVAAGTPYLGNPAFATTQCKVLYIENETAKYDFQRRGKRLNFREIEENIFTLLDDFPTLRDKKNAEALHAFAVQNEIGLIVIDTFRSVAGGIMEEKAEEIRRIFDNLKPFMESGITVVILDHTRKPHLNEGGMIPKKEQLLGSQDKFSAPEAVIMLRTKPVSKTESGSTANIFIHPLKNKGGVEAKPFQVDIVHVDDPDGGGTTTLTYVDEIDAKVLQAAVTEDAINDYLAGQTERRATAEIVEALKGRAGKSSIETKLKELREAKKVGFTKDGSKYLYWLLGEEDASGDELPSLFEDKPTS
jgi:hypothetical protein